MSDVELVAAAVDGDKAAFGALAVRHQGLAVGVCSRFLRDHDLASDVVQEAIVVALVQLERLAIQNGSARGCVGSPSTSPASGYVTETVSARFRRRHVIILEEPGGDRQLPIWVGPAEATALAVDLANVEMPRPMTYQFASSLLAAAGATVQEVRVTQISEGTFYAVVVIDTDRSDAR